MMIQCLPALSLALPEFSTKLTFFQIRQILERSQMRIGVDGRQHEHIFTGSLALLPKFTGVFRLIKDIAVRFTPICWWRAGSATL